MERQIKIGLCFVWRIGLLILSVLNLSLGTKFCRVLLVALNWIEGGSGNQVSQQNSSYLWRYKVKSVGKKCFACLFWLSALLLPFKLSCGCLYVDWHWRELITPHDCLFCICTIFFIIIIFCCLIQMYHSRGVAQKEPCLKITFFRTQSQTRTERTDFFTFMQVFRFFGLFFCVCTAHK